MTYNSHSVLLDFLFWDFVDGLDIDIDHGLVLFFGLG
jgi:hypothetical protein